MKIKLKEKIHLNMGDRKIIKKFAIFPVKINNEIRWLETVYIEQEFHCNCNGVEGWFDIRFVSEEDYFEKLDTIYRVPKTNEDPFPPVIFKTNVQPKSKFITDCCKNCKNKVEQENIMGD